MKKKLVVLLLGMSIALVGCGDKTEPTVDENIQTLEDVVLDGTAEDNMEVELEGIIGESDEITYNDEFVKEHTNDNILMSIKVHGKELTQPCTLGVIIDNCDMYMFGSYQKDVDTGELEPEEIQFTQYVLNENVTAEQLGTSLFVEVMSENNTEENIPVKDSNVIMIGVMDAGNDTDHDAVELGNGIYLGMTYNEFYDVVAAYGTISENNDFATYCSACAFKDGYWVMNNFRFEEQSGWNEFYEDAEPVSRLVEMNISVEEINYNDPMQALYVDSCWNTDNKFVENTDEN